MRIGWAVLVFTSFLAAFGAQAEPIKLTCSSVFQEQEPITVAIDSITGTLMSLEIQGRTAWQFDADGEDATTYPNASDVLDHTGLMSELNLLANPNGVPISKAFLSIVASVWTSGSSLKEKLEIISDDSSGLIYLELWDANGNMIGNALSWGWAGNFKDCK